MFQRVAVPLLLLLGIAYGQDIEARLQRCVMLHFISCNCERVRVDKYACGRLEQLLTGMPSAIDIRAIVKEELKAHRGSTLSSLFPTSTNRAQTVFTTADESPVAIARVGQLETRINELHDTIKSGFAG